MNPYHGKGGKFAKKPKGAKSLANAKATAKRPILSSSSQTVEGQPGQYGATMTKKSGTVSRTAAQTVALMPAQQQANLAGGGGTPPMPPFDPKSPEEWMLMAAQRAWAKFPERAASVGLRPAPYPTSADTFGPFNNPSDPTHDQSVVSAARVMQYLLARFNPIRGLTPQRLGEYLEQWSLGFLRWLALSWNMIRERDDQIKNVVTQREFAVAKLQWEIITVDDSAEAKSHQQALKDFYDGLTCTHVLDQNENGGVNLLIRQMMRAIGDKFAVHEIVWQPGEKLTAQLRFVPLWFFENRTGQLRYLPYELALDGIPLDAGGWLVTTGDGLNFATSIAYIYKQLALKDWARYSEKFGIPMILGKTPAAYNSTEWSQLVEALAAFNSDGAMVVNKAAEITPFEVGRAGEMPQEALCDRMDRAIARLWRGGDLSTMSRGGGGGAGALPQIQQEEQIAEADSILLSEALNFYVDRYVIKYKFGADKPLASFKIIPPRTLDNNQEIATDKFLISAGVPIGKQDLARRYDRPITLLAGDEPATIQQATEIAAAGEQHTPGAEPNGSESKDPAAGATRKEGAAGKRNGANGARAVVPA